LLFGPADAAEIAQCYLSAMTTYSVAEAKSKLSELIDRALAGEDVVITRRGRAVVRLHPVPPPARQLNHEDLDWLAARRLDTAAPKSDAGRLLSTIRDKDDR
jgi:prevent-host-death family protein